MKIHVKVAKDKRAIDVAHNATLFQVASLITQAFDGDLSVSSLTLLFKGRAFKPGQSQRDADTVLHNAGIREGALLMALANSNKTVQQAIESSADDSLMRGFEEELALTARRQRATGRAPKLVSGKYTFQKYYALPAHILPGAYPPPQKAIEFLHRLASDPGIVGVMQQQQFIVGCLSEMPPQDFMDSTRAVTCLLGLNVNQGQEIKLRLRTNDLKGFRNYERIRETLVHELTHNVWRDHDNSFKELNSRLLRECVRINRVQALARTALGDAEVRDVEAMERVPTPGPVSNLLGGHAQGSATAAQAAAAAAAQRHAAAAIPQTAAEVDIGADGCRGNQVAVVRAFEQATDEHTRAEEAALAAWGSIAPSGEQHGISDSTPSTGQAQGRHMAAPMDTCPLMAPDELQFDGCTGHNDEVKSSGAAVHAGVQDMPAAEGGQGHTGGDTSMSDTNEAPSMPSEVVHEMVQSIGQLLWRQHGGDAMVALQTVQRILRNAAQKGEAKYRCIRRQNELFAARVARFPEAEALLTVAGFQLHDDVWTLPSQHSAHTLVRVHAEVAQVLQRCQ